MGYIFRLGLRNLLRQKRRNILLGIGIVFGMMILVIANSFSQGMVDVLINDLVSQAFGHVIITAREGNNSYVLIRDKEKIINMVKETVNPTDLIAVYESIGMNARAVGNGKVDDLLIIGISPEQNIYKNLLQIVEGDYDDCFRKDLMYPVIISPEKAETLNVGLGDLIKVRVPMVTGQIQSVQLVVVGIAKTSNVFMDKMALMSRDKVKDLLGYRPWEAAGLAIAVKDPKNNATRYADEIHGKLRPDLLSIIGRIGTKECLLLAFKDEPQAKEALAKSIIIVEGDREKSMGREGVMVSKEAAHALGLSVGDEVSFSYSTKFDDWRQIKLKIDALFTSGFDLNTNLILVNGEKVYKTYNTFLPLNQGISLFTKEDPLYSVFGTGWKLFERSKNSTELQKKYRQDRRLKTGQAKYNVSTMYEGASAILNLEGALNLLSGVVVLVLFCIILIGIVNTLRMTIKERTGEIGTMRAIGMQKEDVRNLFIMETLILSFISCSIGILLGVLGVQLLGLIRFDPVSSLGMILKDQRLYFQVEPLTILRNTLIIMGITGIATYFPARRAAKFSAAEAFMHYK